MQTVEPSFHVPQAHDLLVPTNPSSVPALGEPGAPDIDNGFVVGTPLALDIAATDNLSRSGRAALFEDDHATLIGVAPPKSALHGMADMADEDLMAAITSGNHSALEQLYDRHVSNCFGLALKIVRDPSVAEEITQEVFFKIWSLPDLFFEQRSKFIPWLSTEVHHRSIDKLRAMSAGLGNNTLPLDTANDLRRVTPIDALLDASLGPHDSAWMNETGRIVRDALLQLTEEQHEAIVLAYFEGLTHSEIATKLNRPLGAVKTHTRAALRALRVSFLSQGLLNEE